MYMPQPYHHEEWESRRAKLTSNWTENQQAKKKHEAEAYAVYPAKKSYGGNLSLAKSFKYVLATHVMFSEQEANQLVYNILNGKFAEDY